MRVLVIEDDQSVRETLGMVLEAYRYNVELCPDGADAIRRILTSWPDVMLLDLTLQDSSGEEVYAKIRERFGRVPPTIVLSAAQEGAGRTSQMPGARFLAKPYTLDQLVAAIEETAGKTNRQIPNSA